MDPIPEECRAAILDALLAGRKIEAIRLAREATGCGLAEAKKFVDDLAEAAERERPGMIPRSTGCGALLAIAFAVILVCLR